ncbi:hypothetical protein V1318_16070 [Lysobacter sp. CCNWLW3]|uniref:hypothetical protein n=1 Tax=unclassified Lysobacter TaxID=2635362 RepID=UPI002FD1BA3F
MRKGQGRVVMAVAALVLMFGGAADAIDSRGAVRAANAWTRFSPGDDIQFDHRAKHVHIADLDRDGVEEVVYLQTATCIGAGFDCNNEVTVMTPLREDDPRVRNNRPFFSDATIARIRRTVPGAYVGDASLQVPGDVRTLAIVGDRIQVTFDVARDSPICNRSHGPRVNNPCPEPGRYRWTLSWRPGALSKTREVSLGRGGKAATPGAR